MWVLDNRTPFAAERTWVRDRNGAEVWIVAVKGSFQIDADGTTKLADEQTPIERVPKYRSEPGKSSLLYEADLVPTKRTTDVLLHGHAYAPPGRPATQVDVTLKVGDLVKTLRVHGDRYWKNSLLAGVLSEPEPFQKMPITYERAYGGTDQKSDNPKKHGWEPRNPVGTGFAVASEHLSGQRAPNVEYPKAFISRTKRPAGLGPIASNWSPRVELAGTYDDKWKNERLPLVPEDFDERFYLCAPEDQQTAAFLEGGEPIELHNLTLGGALHFGLPQVVLGFRTYFFDGEVVDHRANLHTVILEPDIPRVLIVWHTALPCHSKVLKLQKTVILWKKRVKSVGQILGARPNLPKALAK